MIISTKKGTPQVELDRIVDNFEKQGLSVTLIRGTDYNVFGLVGDTTKIAEKDVLANPWVENVTRVSAPYKRANRLFHPEDTVVDINGVRVGQLHIDDAASGGGAERSTRCGWCSGQDGGLPSGRLADSYSCNRIPMKSLLYTV